MAFLPPARAQVSGKLTDAEGRPLPHAGVLLLQASDSALVKFALTNDSGVFQLSVPPGEHFLRFTYTGFRPRDLPAGRGDMGVIVLQPAARDLNEVVVRAEKPLFQQSAGGLVVNVAGSVLSRGNSALQVLERSPGVTIDQRNAGISLNGKDGVAVMLNGKVQRMSTAQLISLLGSMSADNIEKIELIATPGAGFDAEGSAGFINIVLKKDKRAGTRGAMSATAGHGWGEKGTISLQLAHNRKKLGINGAYTYSRDNTYSFMFIRSTQYMPILGGDLEVHFRDTAHRITNNHEASLELELQLNQKTTTGAAFTFQHSGNSLRTNTHATYNALPDSVLLFNGFTHQRNRWTNAGATFYLAKKLREGETVNLQADYLYFYNNNPSTVTNTFLTPLGEPAGGNDSLFSPHQQGDARTTIRVGVLKADYTRQLTRKLKLEAGIKGTSTHVSSASGIRSLVNGDWVYRSEAKNDVGMQEGVGAAYASLQAQFDSATRLDAGMRYEYAFTAVENERTKDRVIDRRRGVLFPNIALTRRLSSVAELQLSYTKRIGRPTYNDLASFVFYSDPTAVYTGNSLLQPAITHNIKLNYQYRSYAFSLLYSRDEQPIARWQLTKGPAENLLYISPQNMAWQQYLTFQAVAPVKINTWWSMNYGFTGGLRCFKVLHTMQPVEKSYFGYSVTASQLFALPKNWSLEISGWYTGQSYYGSVRSNPAGTLNAGVKKELSNNRGMLQFSVADIFRTLHFQNRYGTLTEEVFNIRSHVDFNTETRRIPVFRLSYSRSFGSGAARQRQGSGSGEEKERIRKD